MKKKKLPNNGQDCFLNFFFLNFFFVNQLHDASNQGLGVGNLKKKVVDFNGKQYIDLLNKLKVLF